jgi:hypothetical protein
VYEPVIVTKEESLSKDQTETVLHPFRVAGLRASGKELERMAWNTMPGYVFLRPFIVPIRLGVSFLIEASPALQLLSQPVRLIVFGLKTREVKPV